MHCHTIITIMYIDVFILYNYIAKSFSSAVSGNQFQVIITTFFISFYLKILTNANSPIQNVKAVQSSHKIGTRTFMMTYMLEQPCDNGFCNHQAINCIVKILQCSYI